MMVASGAALLAVVPFRGAGLVAVVPPLTLLMFSWSFVQSNAIALGLTNHPQIAGSASALLGVSQFSFGAVMAPLVGIAGEQHRGADGRRHHRVCGRRQSSR